MEYLKLHSERTQTLDSLIAFVSAAIDTFIAFKEEPDFPGQYLRFMIGDLAPVLVKAQQELNIHDLVVKVFKVGLTLKSV